MAITEQKVKILMLFCILVCSRSVLCKNIYIKTSNLTNDHCLESPCLTLNQFSLNASYLTHDTNDIALIFDEGNHSLESEFQMVQKISFSMVGNATSFSNASVVIVCNENGSFQFNSVRNVYMSGLKFVGCLGNKIEFVDQFRAEDSKFIGKKYSSSLYDLVYPNGSLIKIFQCTSVNFWRASFEQNELSTVRDIFYSRYKPSIGRYVTVLERISAGGVIYAEKSNIQIVECSFEKNKARTGGAIFINDNSKLTIINSSFLRNHDGSAIYAYDTSLLIANSTFIQNTGRYGGAVTWMTNYGTVTITGSNFMGNEAYYNGGALFWFSKDTIHITITNCNFVNNGAYTGSGGALWLTNINTNATISGNLFRSNTARNRGGVISVGRSNQAIITMNYNHFISNHASQNGGVLSCLKGSYMHEFTDIILNYNLFIDNVVLEDGGIFELINVNMKDTGSNFTNNRANGDGGIFFTEGSNISIIRCSFQSNTAGKDGGVMASKLSNVRIIECDFVNNSVDKDGHAGVIKAEESFISIANASLINNKADFGGVFWTQLAVIEFYNVIVFDNSANIDGGVFHTERSEIAITETVFIDNRADNNGGIMQADRDRISMGDCEFNHSIAGNDGGVIRAYLSEVKVLKSTILNSRAGKDGGVYYFEQGNLTISNQTYIADNQAETGGVIWNDAGVLKIYQTSFTNNKASMGGVIWTDAGTAEIDTASFTGNKAITAAVMWMDRAIIRGNRIKFHENRANYTTIYSLESTIVFTGSSLSSNIGSLCAIESTVQLTDTVMTKMQTVVNQTNMNRLKEGGAITAFQSDITFDGKGLLVHNRASQGGAIHATEARLYVHGSLTVANNTAVKSGGGIYLYQSEFICQRKSALTLLGNTAMEKGGGIYASGSLIKVKIPRIELQKKTMLAFLANKGINGGGLYLEMDSKLVILKSSHFIEQHKVMFTANEADYGGAVYVSDDGMCTLSASDNRACSFQVLALYGSVQYERKSHYSRYTNIIIYFEKNIARSFGNSLYGGLLDRCKVSSLSKLLYYYNITFEKFMPSNNTVIVGGLAYIQTITNIENSDIGSPPVQICFCRDGQPDCSYNPGPVPIRRGQLTEIPLSLAALDQINRPIEATIYNRLSSGNDLCQHHVQTNDGNCSVINFTASLNLNESQSEELTLLTNGPCKEIPNSQIRLKLSVYCPKCPIGFELVEDEEGCRCRCDKNLLPFISNCRPSSKALVRDRNIWIAYLNSTDDSEGYQYLKHPYCPLDYCHPSSSRVEINLNFPNGSDAQCANGRTGLLCGTCQPGLSLSLGSSHCIHCPPHWPVSLTAIIIATLLAGILLVVFIMLLNLTVAIGTLNAIIFYANILAVRNSTFLKVFNTNFATVFVSWLNLEVGIDACFYEGMDAFWKTVLQLAFPTYIISLIIIVIIISEHSNKFSNLIGKRNPVATLATLILLSYTKLLNTVITSLSFAILHYPDRSQRTVWLADASVDYLRGKHVVLFILAGIILIAGIFYTALLLFWPCLLRHQECILLRWMKYPKLCHFIEPYHAPYTFKHRYWTGLLLLSRVLLHLVSAVNTTGDPRLTIVTISLIVASLLLIKGIVANKVYKNRLIDISETIVHFNLLVLASLTWYNLDTTKSQAPLAYISVMITFALLLVIIAVHVYKYTNLFTTIKRSRLIKEILATMKTSNGTKQPSEKNKQNNAKVSVSDNQEEPTYSVIEVHNP